MIIVHVWLSKKVGNQKNVGHASLEIPGRAYVSWWPDQAARLRGDFYPIRNKSYFSDVADEGGRPDWNVRLNGLDENKVVDWWSSFGLVRNGELLSGPLARYNLTAQNCSTVVAIALKQSGADKYADWTTSWSVVWRPQTVLDYARSIERGLNKI